MSASGGAARPVVERGQPDETHTAHVVIVGSGIAGLTTALHAAASGCRVTLVTKDELEHANTRFAQGGIAGVMFADDNAEDHVNDTLTAGAGLSDPEAVRVLVDEGPARIRELIELGVAFDRGADGDFVKGLEAAHSYPRILHAGGDATGTAIEAALVARLRASGARVIEHAFLIDVIVDADGRAAGVAVFVDASLSDAPGASKSEARGDSSCETAAGSFNRRECIDADAVVLATGGAGELYAHTTNPAVATGDGIAAAMRAGAVVSDLEFFQFHPTVLAAGEAFLVSEAVRGEGAALIDDAGRRFAFDAHPDGELAPRDIVARAIAAQMAKQGGHPVRLDATSLGAAFLARRFPTIDAAVRARGLDWATEPIPVTPAAHYLMGGVVTDLFGRTTVPGLYAVGEVARTGVHGANRLASNSLLEGAVFGARVGGIIASDAGAAWPETRSAPLSHNAGAWAHRPQDATGEPRHGATFSRTALQRLLWKHAGLVRDEAGLAQAAGALAAWAAARRTAVTERDLEDENLLQLGTALVAAARARTRSVGAHFRSDAPTPTPAPTPTLIPTRTRTPETTGAAAC